jgi:hypothetical protein
VNKNTHKDEARVTVTLSLSPTSITQLQAIRCDLYGDMVPLSTLCAALLEHTAALPYEAIRKLTFPKGGAK